MHGPSPALLVELDAEAELATAQVDVHVFVRNFHPPSLTCIV